MRVRWGLIMIDLSVYISRLHTRHYSKPHALVRGGFSKPLGRIDCLCLADGMAVVGVVASGCSIKFVDRDH